MKLVASMKHTPNEEFSKLSCNPFDSNGLSILLTGANFFRLCRFVDNQLRITTHSKLDYKISSHVWVNEFRCVVCTSVSNFVVFDNGLEISEIMYLKHKADVTVISFTSMVLYSGGIIAGTTDGTLVSLDKTDDDQVYRQAREYDLPNQSAITSICVSPLEDVVICTFSNNEVYALSLDSDQPKGLVKPRKDIFASQSLHLGEIFGLDTCARKPIVATCGADRSIRVWNYVDYSIGLSKVFQEEPYSVSLHPSGLFILVGFNDCLSLMNILIDDIRPYWSTNIRGSREVYVINYSVDSVMVGNTLQSRILQRSLSSILGQ